MIGLGLPLLVLVGAPAETRLDLGRVAAAALQHAPRAGAARARAESARLAAELQQPSPFPDLLLGGKLWAVPPSSATTSAGATQDAITSDGGLATRYRLYAQLRLPLLRAAAARQAGEVIKAAAVEGERAAAVERGLLLRDVGAAYVLLRATAAAAPADAALIDVRERQLRVARDRLAGGLGTATEVARAEEALRAAQLLDEEARRSGETARTRLEALSGLDLRGAALLPPPGRPCGDPAEAARLAALRRPEVHRLEAEAARLRAQAPLAWRDNFDVTIGLGGSHGTTGALDELNGLSAMLELRGGLDGPLRARRQIARDQSAARAAQLEAAAAAEQVAFEARSACDVYQRALGQSAVLEARVATAAADHERLLSRREMVGALPEGIVEMPQLLEAEAAGREAAAQLVQAHGQIEMGHVAALLAQGEPLAPGDPPPRDPAQDEDDAAAPGRARGTLYAATGALPAAGAEGAPATSRAEGAPAARPVRGMWVWHTRRLLAEPGAPEALRAFVRARGLTEIYLSVQRGLLDDAALRPGLLALVSGLRAGGVRVEALLGEATWHLPARRPEMLARIGEIAAWNRAQGPGGGARFDGVHLDVEPQQLAANKGRGNLAFLPDLTAALREARVATEAARLSLAADLPRKVLRAGPEERAALRAACPRLVFMLYETRGPAEIVQAARQALGPGADVVVALRPEDHERIGAVLDGIGEALGREPGYAGWAVHDYESYRKR